MKKAKTRKPIERHIDDLKREIGNAEIGSNDDGSFFAPDGTLWFPSPKRKGWFFPLAKLSKQDAKKIGLKG